MHQQDQDDVLMICKPLSDDLGNCVTVDSILGTAPDDTGYESPAEHRRQADGARQDGPRRCPGAVLRDRVPPMA